MLRDDNKSMSARLAALEDNLRAAAKEATPTIYSAVKRHLSPLGAVNPKVAVSIPSDNTVDGEYEVSVGTFTTYGSLTYKFRLPMKAGAPVITEAAVVEAFTKALDEQKNAPADIAAREEFEFDLASVEAERRHDLVLYSTKLLPEWGFITPVASLKDAKGHPHIAAQILNSLRGYILSNMGKAMKFSAKEFSLPVVKATEVKAAAKPVELHEIPGFNTPKTAHEIQAEITHRNLIASGKISAQAPSELQAADEEVFAFQQDINRRAHPLVERFVRSVLKGDAPKVVGSDFSSLRRKADGMADGKLLVAVKFYAAEGEREAEIEVPFESGKAVSEGMVKSARSVEAERKRQEELKVLSAEEAKARFEEFKARQAANAEDMLASGLAVSASDDGIGQNMAKKGPSPRIPVLKALLPADVKAGSEILVGSFVYKVADTDYNSVSAEKSAFYMLCLTDKIPTADMPSMGVWGSLGGIF
jgi:hypothetical protein